MFFFCFPPNIRTEAEPFNLANRQNGCRPSEETWFSLIGRPGDSETETENHKTQKDGIGV